MTMVGRSAIGNGLANNFRYKRHFANRRSARGGTVSQRTISAGRMPSSPTKGKDLGPDYISATALYSMDALAGDEFHGHLEAREAPRGPREQNVLRLSPARGLRELQNHRVAKASANPRPIGLVAG
jgi:hypothetical protein